MSAACTFASFESSIHVGKYFYTNASLGCVALSENRVSSES